MDMNLITTINNVAAGVEDQSVESEDQVENIQQTPTEAMAQILANPNLNNFNLALLNAMAAPIQVSNPLNYQTYLPTFFNTLRANVEQTTNQDRNLVPPSDTSASPDAIQKEQPKKRSRQKKREFPIEMGDVGVGMGLGNGSGIVSGTGTAAGARAGTGPRKRGKHISTSDRDREEYQETTEYYNNFTAEVTQNFEMAINALNTAAEQIANSNCVPLMGQALQITQQAEKMREELQMWTKMIPHARTCIYRRRMSGEDQSSMNSMLAHYKAEHPEQFDAVLKLIAQLFSKEERIVKNNYKRSLAREAVSQLTESFQIAFQNLVFREMITSASRQRENLSQDLSQNAAESAETHEDVELDYSTILSMATRASSTIVEAPGTVSEQNSSGEPDPINTPVFQQPVPFPGMQAAQIAAFHKLMDICHDNSSTANIAIMMVQRMIGPT